MLGDQSVAAGKMFLVDGHLRLHAAVTVARETPLAVQDPVPDFDLDMQRLLADESTADLVFGCRDGECRAHRLIVAARSPVLRAALQAEGQDGKTRLDLPQWTSAAFGSFLRFCYTGILPGNEDSKSLIELLHIGHRYEVPSLADWCVDGLLRTLSHDTVWDYCSLGHRLHLYRLTREARAYADLHSHALATAASLRRFEAQDPVLYKILWLDRARVLETMNDHKTP